MLSKVRVFQVFLLLLLISVKIYPEISQKVEVTDEITIEQILSKLSDEDKTSLIQFFKFMLLQSQGGYVLYGVKPICLDSIDICDSRPKSNLGFHLNRYGNEIMMKGLEVWNRLPISKHEATMEIIVYHQPDPPLYDNRHVLFIHRKAFLETVNKSLPLFKAILGQETTAESLLNKLGKPDSTFFSTLASNKILMGIVLGFGVENAIYGSREESIDEQLGQIERPPLARRTSRAGISLINDRYPGVETLLPLKGDELRPSFGYKTLLDERRALAELMASSTELIVRSSPSIPLFSCLKKHNRETGELLAKYAEAQTKIQSLLSSETFLQDTLNLILGDKPLSTLRKPLETFPFPSFEVVLTRLKKDNSKSELAAQVTDLLWDNLLESEKDSAYVEKFMGGMQAIENDRKSKKISHDIIFDMYKPIIDCITATKIKYAHQNFAEGEKALQSIAKDKDIIRIVDGKLHYKILKKGHGPKLTLNQNHATIQYLFTYLGGRNSDKLIASNVSDELNMSELIPGLAHGMLVMQEEEIREIYIHPEYAYGFQSNFDPGVAIKARVELLSLPPNVEGTSTQFPKLLPVDKGIIDFPEVLAENKIEELRLKAAHAEGYCAWWFFGLGSDDLYTLKDVLTNLRWRQKDSGKVETVTSDFVPSDLLRVLQNRLDDYLKEK